MFLDQGEFVEIEASTLDAERRKANMIFDL